TDSRLQPRESPEFCKRLLGQFPVVSLAEARAAALENARAIHQGRDPRADAKVPTFAVAAESVIRLREPTWRKGGDVSSVSVWRSSLERFAYPTIGDKRVDAITAPDVLRCIAPIWTTKRTTARNVKSRISIVMRWCIAQRYRTDDPSRDIDTALPGRNRARPQHHKALPYSEVAESIRTIRQLVKDRSVRLAFEFMVLTAARTGEVRFARWGDIDVERRIWTVPAERMKAGRLHRVPLSDRALEVLDEARALTDGHGFIFPSRRTGREFSTHRLIHVCKDAGLKCSPHGYRSSFRDWVSECTDYPREVAELSLAHANGDRTEAAYARSDLLDRRAALMADWATYVTAT
ncbi:MAG: site-specific integrase, partial [Spirochaetaceae bacterium]|nr:site-specific integrase [Spirochaetaceae bacterium]